MTSIPGIFVKNIVEDSPAAEVTDLKPGDQILAVNGQALPASKMIIKNLSRAIKFRTCNILLDLKC